VTGASSGIGLATAKALARRGHPVVLGARRVERCAEAAAAVRADGGEAHALALDLADPASIASFVAGATERVGEADVVVSCAGRDLPDPDLGADDDTVFDTTLAVNLSGAHRLVGLVLPPMVRRRRGDLVFVTSETVRAPRPRNKAYVASKWGLEGYARTLQMELEGTGVRASIVQPGQTLTEMGSDWEPQRAGAILEEWVHFGLARHSHFLNASAVADAIVTVIETAPGTHLTLIEVQPEAPVRRDRTTSEDTT